MKAPYEENYPIKDILTGQVTCPHGDFLKGSLVSVLLILTHLIFLLAPAILTPFLLRARPRLEGRVRSYNTLILSMFAFVLASVGEIAQHCFDNWLYIDSRVSTYNFVFYLMTTASNALLASGLGLSTPEVLLSVLACMATPISFGHEYLLGKPYMSTASQIPIWIGMFGTTLQFIYRGWQLQMPVGRSEKLAYTIGILATYVLGVIFGQKIVTTGDQFWHLFTASSFCSGFAIQGRWLVRAYTGNDLHRD